MDRLRHFFVAQAYYTRMSHLFYGLMFVVVLAQVLVMFVVVGAAVYFATGDVGVPVFLWVVGLFALYLLMGLLIGLHRTRHGGTSIARSAHAVQLFIHPASSEPLFTERFIRVASPRQLPAGYARYHEFAEQMAIASGVPLPKLYVLPFEMGVNGFVAGYEDDDMVMVLTQGAVDKLTNAELYGLIGHEFGHILHGDARLNLRIYVMLSMLGWVYDLVDVLEELVLGKFDKNYHDHYMTFGRSPILDEPVANNRQQWVSYLRDERRAIEYSHAFSGQSYGLGSYRHTSGGRAPVPEAYAGALLAQVAFILPLLILRLIGALGMLGAEWVKKHFNHSREYLADATSVQLTRSPDVVAALQSLTVKHPAALRGHDFSTTMAHFFFASPKDGDEKSDSHPNIYERIQFAKDGDYDELGSQIVAELDVVKLERARDFVLGYDYVNDDEISASATDAAAMADVNPLLIQAQTDEQGHTRVSYDVAPDKVVDGRLIINDDWRTPAVAHDMLYPRLGQTHERVPRDYDGTVDHLNYDIMCGIELPWQMVKVLGGYTGAVHFIEILLLCRTHEQLDPNSDTDFGMIYGHGDPDRPIIARHRLPYELLKALTYHDRRLDGLMLVLGFRRLGQLVARLSQDDAINARAYQDDLARLINASYEPKYERYAGVRFDADWLQMVGQGRLEMLYRAAIIGAMWQTLAPAAASVHVLYHQLSEQRDALIHWLVGVDDDEHVLLVLMAYLVSVQDNSLQLMRYERLTSSLRRWCTSLQLTVADDDTLTTLIYQVQVLDAMDWLILLLAVAERDTARLSLILDTLCTACVYDGKVAQAEYDLLAMLAVMWGVPMPVV